MSSKPVQDPKGKFLLSESHLETRYNKSIDERRDAELQQYGSCEPPLFPDEQSQIKPPCKSNPTPKPEMSSRKTTTSTPRIVRVSGSFLRERPRRFRIAYSNDKESDEQEPILRPEMFAATNAVKTDTRKTQQQGPKHIAQQTTSGPIQLSDAVAIPAAEHLSQKIDHPPKMDLLDVATAVGGKEATGKPRTKRNYSYINGIPYMRVGNLGKGGSARVYRVINEDDVVLALKRVNIKNVDASTVRGFKSEIHLLNKLSKVNRVVNLRDWELDTQKQVLSLVMEFGQLDFESILKQEINKTDAYLDLAFVRNYWKEMLECVAAVHRFNIVHSDLKPANFVLVGGYLKIIDFGIANLIGDDTVNVHRDHQVGTPNFMAPEALLDVNKSSESWVGGPDKLIKVGKSSDIWSLGCILYQMTYGKAPFSHIPNYMHRAMAIINSNYTIEYPALGVGSVKVPLSIVQTIRRCLSWNQELRPTTEMLLSSSDKFLYPDNPQDRISSESPVIDISEAQLGSVLQNVVRFCKSTGANPVKEEVEDWSKIFFEKLQET